MKFNYNDLTNVETISDLEIDHIGLMSKKEARLLEKENKRALIFPKTGIGKYWLSSNGHQMNYDGMVSEVISPDPNKVSEIWMSYLSVELDNIVRPVIYIKSNNLQVYKQYKYLNQLWIAISDHSLLYNGDKIILRRFDASSDKYENSEISQYVQNYFLNDISK